MSVIIKCFGYDTECLNISDFESVLIDKYKNMQISIISKNASGINKLTLVKVQCDGSLIGSHCGTSISLTGFF
jgi:hypothetical protein